MEYIYIPTEIIDIIQSYLKCNSCNNYLHSDKCYYYCYYNNRFYN